MPSGRANEASAKSTCAWAAEHGISRSHRRTVKSAVNLLLLVFSATFADKFSSSPCGPVQSAGPFPLERFAFASQFLDELRFGPCGKVRTFFVGASPHAQVQRARHANMCRRAGAPPLWFALDCLHFRHLSLSLPKYLTPQVTVPK